MVSDKKTKSSKLFYIGWVICVAILLGLSVWGIDHFYSGSGKDYSKQNDRLLEELFSELEQNYQVMVAPDNLNTSYIDSLNAEKLEYAQVIEKTIISQVVERIGNNTNDYYLKMENSNRTLFIWGAVLAFVIILTILFAYIGIKRQLRIFLVEQAESDLIGRDRDSEHESENIYRDNKATIEAETPKPVQPNEEIEKSELAEKTIVETIRETPVESPVFVPKEPEKEVVSEPVASNKQPEVPVSDYDKELQDIVQGTKDDEEKISSLKNLIGDIKENKVLNVEQKNSYLYKAFFYMAQLFGRTKKNDKALDIYNKLISNDPRQPAVFFERGNLYNDSRQYEEAIADYTNALELYPDSSEAYFSRGMAFLNLRAYEQAIGDFDSVRNLDNNNPEAIFYHGYASFKIGDYDKALEDFNLSAGLNYPNPKLYNLRGILLSNSGEYTQAVKDFDKAIELDGEYAKAYKNRGYVYTKLLEFDKAVEDYNEAMALDPNMADVLYKRGEAFYLGGDYEKAISDFDIAIEINPSDVQAYTKRGTAYYNLGKYEEALSDFDKTLSLTSENVDDIRQLREEAFLKIKGSEETVVNQEEPEEEIADEPVKQPVENEYFAMATAAFNKNDFGAAIGYFDKAVELEPDNAQILFMRGMAHNYQRDYGSAVADFDRSLLLSPAQSDVYYNRGNAYMNMQKMNEALADYTQAIHYNPVIPEVYFNRGNVYYNLGQYREALQDYTKATELHPEYAKAYFNRGLAYKALKQPERSIEDFKKVISLDPKNYRVVDKAQKQVDILMNMLNAGERLEE